MDMVTAVSDFVRQRFRSSFPGRCETVYNGVNAGQFIQEKDWKALARRSKKRILFVGAVAPHSGVHVLLEAFRTIAAVKPEVELDIVGPQVNYPIEEVFELSDWCSVQSVAPFYRREYWPPKKAALRSGQPALGTYAKKLQVELPTELASRVNFVGPIGTPEELIARYYDADVFAFSPVCNHGFGLPPVEAMAAGTPVVASLSGGLTETIVDGQTGRLVAKDDAPALARGLLDVLDNDLRREAMGRAARKRVLDSFTWELSAEKLYEYYLDLCHAKESFLVPQVLQFNAAASNRALHN